MAANTPTSQQVAAEVPRQSCAIDYTTVTESPGHRLLPEAMSMIYTRYAYAREFCTGKEVLELACGPGHGLGYLAQNARRVVGGDYSLDLLQRARRHYRDRVPLLRLDAHKLPFAAGSFDVVILFEAIYYLQAPQECLAECARVLRAGGTLLICSANREWSSFNRSPYTYRYFSAEELRALLEEAGFHAEIRVGFPVADSSAARRMIGVIRSLAIRAHLIPKTMKGKELLKRLFYGPLQVMGHEIEDGMAERGSLSVVQPGTSAANYKVIYATGLLQDVGRRAQVGGLRNHSVAAR